MKKLFIKMFVLIFALAFSLNTYASFETDVDAFKIGDAPYKSATLSFLGEKKILKVWELKDQLRKSGYGNYFAKDTDESYTEGVDRAFKEYADSYLKRMKAAEQELNQANTGKIADGQ